MQNYKSQIKNAKNAFELSCIDELIRDAYFNKHSISKAAYEKRSEELSQRITELRK